MGWFGRFVHRPARTRLGGRRRGGESALGPQAQDALSQWESEGGAAGAIRDENVDAVGKAGEEEQAKQDSMTNTDDNAMGQTSSSQSAKDAAADAAGNPAEQGGQG